MSEPAPLAVYVHWPYCARICPYCDFNVLRDRGQAEQGALADAIVRDLEGQARIAPDRRLSSIFFGGGTPSLMTPAWVARIIETASRLWPADGPVEITLEANPTDAETSRFADLRAAGVNRLSLGLQSLDDAALTFLGRNHSAAEGRRAAQTAMNVFDRVSLDMIYARPRQTPDAWASELRQAVALGPEHISPYQLTIESGTAFDLAYRRGELIPPEADDAADLYETTQAVLGEAGYQAYEVSNHARNPFARSVHNLAYWRGWDYAGVGPGAHGRLTTPDGRRATEAERTVGGYIKAVEETGRGAREAEMLTPRDAAIERLFLGLRSTEGVPMSDLTFLELDREKLASHVAAGLLVVAAGRLIAPGRGRAVLDRLTADLIG